MSLAHTHILLHRDQCLCWVSGYWRLFLEKWNRIFKVLSEAWLHSMENRLCHKLNSSRGLYKKYYIKILYKKTLLPLQMTFYPLFTGRKICVLECFFMFLISFERIKIITWYFDIIFSILRFNVRAILISLYIYDCIAWFFLLFCLNFFNIVYNPNNSVHNP